MGADIVSLANNHAYDYGEAALEDSFASLNDAGIVYEGSTVNNDAEIYGNASVSDGAIIMDTARIFGQAHVAGGARIDGDTALYDEAAVQVTEG